jgi:acyl carrier protein
MRKDILKIINNILKENFNFKKKVGLNTDLSKIKNWDSLKHLDFIMSLEKCFKIKFNLQENYQIILIKNFITLIKKKII